MEPVLELEHECTIRDIYDMPEGQRAELIDGQIYNMAPPARKHQEVTGELFFRIQEYIRSHQGSCRAVRCFFG